MKKAFLSYSIYNNIFKPKIIKNDEKDYCKNGHDGRGGYYV